LRSLSRDARSWLSEYERRQRERTDIQTLKVGFNKVHGYYIEVTKVNTDRVPADYVRKQTLVNAERFHSPELREFEERILTAEERMKVIELTLFEELRAAAAAESGRIQETASSVATCLAGRPSRRLQLLPPPDTGRCCSRDCRRPPSRH
jgi:DNA mismatch repair protein MutS